jgi:hypothetical protein
VQDKPNYWLNISQDDTNYNKFHFNNIIVDNLSKYNTNNYLTLEINTSDNKDNFLHIKFPIETTEKVNLPIIVVSKEYTDKDSIIKNIFFKNCNK